MSLPRVSQRSETNLLVLESNESEASALRSLTLKVTPFFTTACFGSGKRIDAGVQPWQMPHQVGMQRPEVCPVRLAQISPCDESHALLSVQVFAQVTESMPWFFETRFSTSCPPKAFSYFFAAESLEAPSHL